MTQGLLALHHKIGAVSVKLFNHGPHIVLDLLTCGLWLPIHILLWACAPTVPIGSAASAAAAAGSANTTIVFGSPGQHPQVMHAQPQPTAYPYGQHPVQPQTMPPYQPPQISQPVVPPPVWAIEEARERLPIDAPWEAVASMAWEYVHRRERELPWGESEPGGPAY